VEFFAEKPGVDKSDALKRDRGGNLVTSLSLLLHLAEATLTAGYKRHLCRKASNPARIRQISSRCGDACSPGAAHPT
jgi:hypothetical protein